VNFDSPHAADAVRALIEDRGERTVPKAQRLFDLLTTLHNRRHQPALGDYFSTRLTSMRVELTL
jgi:hypothetical protein